MNATSDTPVVAISVTREILEYRIGAETRLVVNSAECFPQVIKQALADSPAATFLVEAVGGWETGVVRALQMARLPVAVVESGEIQRYFGLAEPENVDAAVVSLYARAMWETLGPAERVERVVSGYAGRPLVKGNWWTRLFGQMRSSRQRPAARLEARFPAQSG